MEQRIQKVLAHQGLGSRRQIEAWIQEGRIRINQKIAKLGDRITDRDAVYVDGTRIRTIANTAFLSEALLYYKPAGQMCTRYDPEQRPTIFQYLPSPQHGRWVSIGRLDFQSAGLLLLTNDGAIAHEWMHPKHNILREYHVRIQGQLKPEQITALLDGVMLEDGPARVESLDFAGGQGTNVWYAVTLSEGRNREVRRLFEAVGTEVNRLIRTRYGHISLPRTMKAGEWQALGIGTLKR